MGSYPWGPHGPETSPYDVRPNPTPQTVFPNIGGGGDYAAPYGGATHASYGGGVAYTGGGANPLLSIVLSLIMLPFVWMFWICLYPLTAAAGMVAGFATVPLAMRTMSLKGDERDVAAMAGVIVGFAVFVVMSRVEYRMARNTGYRVARHVVRLLLFGVLAMPWLAAMMVNGPSTPYILAMLANPSYLLAQMTIPRNLAIVIGVMVGMHFLLWKAERLRNFWHRRLMWIGLK